MKKLLIFLWLSCLFAFETDFDCIVVGTNPISMFEAIYKRSLGNRVLVVEQASECGGAWKSITICGIPNVDLGCHEFGNDVSVKRFLEEYAGCKMVPNAPPGANVPNWGFYPSGGCYELTHNLELLMQHVGVVLALNSKLQSVYIDANRGIAEVKINDQRYTTSKIVVTHCSNIEFENPQYKAGKVTINQFPHMYLLISDPTPSRFTYINFSYFKCSRAMNLTRFAGLEGSGKQLIVFQHYEPNHLNIAEKCLNELKRMGQVSPQAQLIQLENYIFEQAYLNQGMINQVRPSSIFEVLNTSHIANIRLYIDRWKQGMKPWKDS